MSGLRVLVVGPCVHQDPSLIFARTENLTASKTQINSMKNLSVKNGQPFKVLVIILSLSALPLAGVLTGCRTGDRYQQSTGEYIDDHTLTSRVKKTLGDDVQYKYGDVNVVTFKGVVQLSGFVNTNEQKKRAGDLAKSVPAVNEVQNNITVK